MKRRLKPKKRESETKAEAQARQRKARIGMALANTGPGRRPKATISIEPRVYEPGWRVYRALPGQKIVFEVESVEAWERLWSGLESRLREWLTEEGG